MKTKVKTIDIQALEWFDRVNGNSYFAGYVTINYGMKTAQTFTMPFQYGYGEQYIQEARNMLIENNILPESAKGSGLTSYCRENNILMRQSKQQNCKKRDLKNLV